jgi:hypothetical protein
MVAKAAAKIHPPDRSLGRARFGETVGDASRAYIGGAYRLVRRPASPQLLLVDNAGQVC